MRKLLENSRGSFKREKEKIFQNIKKKKKKRNDKPALRAN